MKKRKRKDEQLKGFRKSDLSEVGVGVRWSALRDESEVGDISDTIEGAGDGASGSGHGGTVAGLVIELTEGREVDDEALVSVGDWDLEAVVVWGEGEVSDEVGAAVGLSVVGANDGDIGGFSAGGVVHTISVQVGHLLEEDENLDIGAIEDTFEGGEGAGTGPEDTTDGDEVSGVAVEVEGAGGVDWGVSGVNGGDGTTGGVDRLAGPFGGGGNGGEGGGDLHI